MVMQTPDFVSGLHNCLKFSQPLSRLYQAIHTENISYCYGSEGNTGFVCILKVLESPCLNFKIKIVLKVLENCSRGWKVLEFQCLLYPTQQTQRNLEDEIAHVVEELERLKTLFCSEWSL